MTADHAIEVALDAIQVGAAAGVGQVVRAGAHALGLLDRRVLVGPIDPCGECDVCRSGGVAVCPAARRRAALDSPAVVAARWAVPLDDGLELPGAAAAAVAGDAALAYTLYARAGVGPRDPVIVVGGAPITRWLLEILAAKAIAPIAVTGPGPLADWSTAHQLTVARDRADVTAALAARGLGTRPWRLVCGDPTALADALALAGPRAQLTALAAPAPADALADALGREVTIVGVAAAHPDLVVEAAAMCVKGELDLARGTTLHGPDPLRTQVRRVT